MVVDLARTADLLHATGVHDGDPVGHRERLFLVVRHVDERRPELALDALQLRLHLSSQLDVEGTEGLVEEEGGRVVHEGARECHPLLLATRELPRPATLEPFELDDPEHRLDPLPMLASRDVLHLQPERHVVVDRHVRKQGVLLEHHVDAAPVRRRVGDVLAVQQDAARVRRLEPGDHPQRRGLPASRRAEQREELTVPDAEVELVDGGVAPEPLADALERDRVDRASSPDMSARVYSLRPATRYGPPRVHRRVPS